MATEHPASNRALPRILVVGAVYLLLALLVIQLTRQPGSVSSAWVSSAFLLAMMLRHPGQARTYLGLGFAMRMLAGALSGDPLAVQLSHATAGTISVGLAYLVTRRAGLSPIGLPDVPSLVWPLLLVGALGPALGGLVPALAHDHLGLSSFFDLWTTWIVASAFGAVVMLPPMLAADAGAWRRLRERVRLVRFVPVLAFTLAVTWLATSYLGQPFMIAALPLLAAGFILGRLGTTLLCSANLAMMVLLRLALAQNGGGPVVSAMDGLMFNLYAGLVALPALVVCVLQSQRRDALEELQRNQHQLFEEKQLAQVTLSSIGDAVITVDPQSRVQYMNRVAQDMTGWSLDEARGVPIDRIMQLVDAETLESGLSPLAVAMGERRAVGLALNTLLVHREGRQSPIEDSAAPIIGMDGELVGGVMVFHDVSESRAMALRMSHLAQHDYLTDLPNRVLLQDRLQQALSTLPQGRRGGLMFIDLDHFKDINDTLGHEIGDKLLQAVARRLVCSVREDDTVSRQGGDEFVLLMPRLADSRDAARVAKKLITALSEPFVIDEHELEVGASVGISLFPEDGTEPGVLIKRADAALYHAKANGRGRYEYYTQSLGERAEKRLDMERRLRRAIKNGELSVAYQPKVSAAGRRITGCEALVRWHPPDGGSVSPAEFIPIAEESGLIEAIDSFVLREACRQNQAWQDLGLPPLPVAVNVSLARFDGDRLLSLVRQTLVETGLSPDCLALEITETQAMQDTEHTRQVMDALAHMGVKVAMDDFGTGYSSIGSLQRFGFDVIKIDRSLVSPLGSESKHATIVRAIVGMARAFGCQVVAEGVETEQQARLAAEIGCQELQGYLFSRPVPADQVPDLLRRVRLLPAPGETAER